MEICELEKVQGGGGAFFQLEAHWLYIYYQLNILLEEKSLLRDTFTAIFPTHVLKLPKQLKHTSLPELDSAGQGWGDPNSDHLPYFLI